MARIPMLVSMTDQYIGSAMTPLRKLVENCGVKGTGEGTSWIGAGEHGRNVGNAQDTRQYREAAETKNSAQGDLLVLGHLQAPEGWHGKRVGEEVWAGTLDGPSRNVWGQWGVPVTMERTELAM